MIYNQRNPERPTDRTWLLVGRLAAWFGIALGAVIALGGPALGYYIDTRVFPGHPLTALQRANHVQDQDTDAWTWLIPYMVYGALGLIVSIISFCVRVNAARERLRMRHVFEPLPPKKTEAALPASKEQ
jgi:MFS family permease